MSETKRVAGVLYVRCPCTKTIKLSKVCDLCKGAHYIPAHEVTT